MKRRGLLAGIFGGIAAAFARPAAAKPLEGADSRHTIEVLFEMWIRVGDPNNLLGRGRPPKSVLGISR